MPPVLEVTDVRKRYGNAVALAGATLAVEEGEVFGLLGPNGAGKTTLISILTGLADADSGTVRLFGKPFSKADRDARRLVGVGTQDLSIYPELTAAENLRFFGRLYGLRGADLEARVKELLAAVGLADRASHRAGTFSGGMKRRLNLAAAVVHRPRLLFLDEPTTGVDPQSRNHIFEQVRALQAAGVTVVYTSHYMEEVQTLCARIAVLDGGAVRACDTLPNLLKVLQATIRLSVAHPPPGFAERLAAVTGVKAVRLTLSPGSAAGEGGGASPPGEGEKPPRQFTLPAQSEDTTPPQPLPEAGRGYSSPAPPSRFGKGAGGLGSVTFELVAEDIAPALAGVAMTCHAAGAELTAVTAAEPTLERVFLHLTGHDLRD